MTELAQRRVPDAAAVAPRPLPTIPRLFSPDGRVWNPPRKWRASGNCASADPDALFVEGAAAQNDVAKKICFGCPVIDICLVQDLKVDEKFGVQGGFTERQRKVLKSGGDLIDLQRRAVAGSTDAIQELQTEAVVISMMERLQRVTRPSPEEIAEKIKEELKAAKAVSPVSLDKGQTSKVEEGSLPSDGSVEPTPVVKVPAARELVDTVEDGEDKTKIYTKAEAYAVLKLFMRGLPDQAVADTLTIDATKVGKYIGMMVRSYEVNSRVAFAIKARREELVKEQEVDLTLAKAFTKDERRVGKKMITDDGMHSSNKEIAAALEIPEETVRENKKSLGEKIGTETPAGIALYFLALEQPKPTQDAKANVQKGTQGGVRRAPQRRARPPEETRVEQEPVNPIQKRMAELVTDPELLLVAEVYGLFGIEASPLTQIARERTVSRDEVAGQFETARQKLFKDPDIAQYLLGKFSA